MRNGNIAEKEEKELYVPKNQTTTEEGKKKRANQRELRKRRGRMKQKRKGKA